jgi:hypothetical protein
LVAEVPILDREVVKIAEAVLGYSGSTKNRKERRKKVSHKQSVLSSLTNPAYLHEYRPTSQ